MIGGSGRNQGTLASLETMVSPIREELTVADGFTLLVVRVDEGSA